MDGWTDGHTDTRTDNVKTVYPPQTKFAGGKIKLERYTKLDMCKSTKIGKVQVHLSWASTRTLRLVQYKNTKIGKLQECYDWHSTGTLKLEKYKNI